jgi:hypothetical protein
MEELQTLSHEGSFCLFFGAIMHNLTSFYILKYIQD